MVAPDPEHGETGAREHRDEAELVVAWETVPEVRTEIRDDQQRAAVRRRGSDGA